MKRSEKRGVVVFVSPHSEANKRIGLYTEEGMVYFTVYGARSSKGHNKSVLSLFTMGRFIFKEGGKRALQFVDVEIYDIAMKISNDIEVYYAACTGAELVKKMIDAEHSLQFKILIDFFLFLLERPQQWHEALIVFFWRSLVCNGWQPKTPLYMQASNSDDDIISENASGSAGQSYVYYTISEGFSEQMTERTESYASSLPSNIIALLLHSDAVLFKDICQSLEVFAPKDLQKCIAVFFDIWQGILGYKLTLSNFVIH